MPLASTNLWVADIILRPLSVVSAGNIKARRIPVGLGPTPNRVELRHLPAVARHPLRPSRHAHEPQLCANSGHLRTNAQRRHSWDYRLPSTVTNAWIS